MIFQAKQKETRRVIRHAAVYPFCAGAARWLQVHATEGALDDQAPEGRR